MLLELFRKDDIRATLLSMLLPFEIATLLFAIYGDQWKGHRQSYMNPFLDLGIDPAPLAELKKAGLRIMFIGKDLKLLFDRLEDPQRQVL